MGSQRWFKHQVLNHRMVGTLILCTPHLLFQDLAFNLAIWQRGDCYHPVTPVPSRAGWKTSERTAFHWKMQPCQNRNTLQTCVGCTENVI